MIPSGVRGVLAGGPLSDGTPPLTHAWYPASQALAPFVERYWSVSWDLAGQSGHQVETLQHPSVHMVFDYSGEARIWGLARGKFVRMLEGKSGVFGVKFRPGGFFPFLGKPVSLLADRIVSLSHIFGRAGSELERVVSAEVEDSGRQRVIDAFLQSRQIETDATARWITEVVYAVASDRTVLKVDDLVARYGVSKRTLQRQFAKYVGATPKWVIQRYRLHEAAAQLVAGSNVNHATLAVRLGYSDQAHFIRDFKATVGVPPAAYAATKAAV